MKTEKKKTLRGSALFTVVAVMAILILFLTGTLALATASNSRAHKSYAVSQASYTARAAIRAFKSGMEQDADLAATVGAIGEGSLTKFEPQIKISDKTMGKIGYWDYSDANHPIWVDDCIKLEPVADKVDWVYDTEKNEWVSWNIVRVTSTCRVGQEEETVVAYISKHGEPGQQKKSNNEVKGLQEAGGNSYANGGDIYGGLGIGLSDSVPGSYGALNDMDTHTNLTFINGDFDVKTSSLDFFAEDNENGVWPVSATVVMGNFSTTNNVAFNVNYTMKSLFTQKDIPYLYVDRLLYSNSSSSLYLVKGNGSPFNIYAGTMYYPELLEADADIYLMDEPATDATPAEDREYYNLGFNLRADGFPELRVPDSMKDKYPDGWPDGQWWANPATEEDKKEAMKDPANIVGTENKIETGKNVFGNTADRDGNKQLYNWTRGTFERTDDSKFDSFGGTIYCNGDLLITQAKIHGDVRVKGRCTIRGKVQIDGDLIVENAYENAGKATKTSGLNNEGDLHVDGRIYVTAGAVQDTSKLKEGYSLYSGLYPGYKQYENKELPNFEVEESAYEIDTDGHYVYDGNVYDSKPYIQCMPLSDDDTGVTVGATVDPKIVTTSETTRFKAFANGRIINADGVYEVTTEKESYYTKDGDPCGRADAIGEYYVDPSGTRVSRSDAYTVSFSGSGNVDVETYKTLHPEGVYPEDMTREKIYGTKEKNADPSTKLVTTLIDARKSLGMDSSDGYFDEKIYIREKPTTGILDTFDSTWDKTKSITVTRPKEGVGWVILDNVKLNAGCSIIVKDNPDAIASSSEHVRYKGGIVRFFIIGDVRLEKGSIGPEDVLNGTIKKINYKDDFGIEYYTGGAYRTHDDLSDPKKEAGAGTEGTLYFVNDAVLVGSVKAPFLELGFENGRSSPITVDYTKEDGTVVKDYKPTIIGNALVKFISSAKNGIPLAYTKSGTGGSSEDDDDLAVDPSGTEWKFKYFTT
ncbi:polymer-forming cytoskeletal protein [Ruminococcus sp.]|uniref:polymer-forming cytoskeletal protein n=1 Tax=Ruminococcus sp. TaxID=41978 RepID=UPI0025FF1424|nr:polymer-forming cytoskeletal protein [Ruminococcus sp.]